MVNLEKVWAEVGEVQRQIMLLGKYPSESYAEGLKDKMESLRDELMSVESSLMVSDQVEAEMVASLASLTARIETIEQILWGEDKVE